MAPQAHKARGDRPLKARYLSNRRRRVAQGQDAVDKEHRDRECGTRHRGAAVMRRACTVAFI